MNEPTSVLNTPTTETTAADEPSTSDWALYGLIPGCILFVVLVMGGIEVLRRRYCRKRIRVRIEEPRSAFAAMTSSTSTSTSIIVTESLDHLNHQHHSDILVNHHTSVPCTPPSSNCDIGIASSPAGLPTYSDVIAESQSSHCPSLSDNGLDPPPSYTESVRHDESEIEQTDL